MSGRRQAVASPVTRAGVHQKAMPAALCPGKSDDSFGFQPQRVRAEGGAHSTRGRGSCTGTRGGCPPSWLACCSQMTSAREPSLLASATEGHLSRDLDPRSRAAVFIACNTGGLSFLCSRLGWLPVTHPPAWGSALRASPVCQPRVPPGYAVLGWGALAEEHFVRETLVSPTRRRVRK